MTVLRNFDKGMRRLVLSVLGIGALLLGGASFAAANTGGGTGGGGGNTGSSNQVWSSVGNNVRGVAWDQFRNQGLSGRQPHTVDREVSNRVVGGIEVCRESHVIWFLESGTGWSYNYTSVTHGPRWQSSLRGSIESPKNVYGRAALYPEVQRFLQWDATKNGNIIDNAPGYTIICSGAFEEPKPITRVVRTVDTHSDTVPVSFSGVYHWITSAQPQLIENGRDPIGANNLHTQSAKYQKTNFGLLYDSLDATDNISVEDVRLLVERAEERDSKLERSKLTLSEANRAGMAEGGVLNVYERSLWATLTVNASTTTTTTTYCEWTQTWNSALGRYNDPVRGNCSGESSQRTGFHVTKGLGMLQTTGFYQMLSVHCNPAGVAALRSADGSLTLANTGDSSGNLSGFLYTKKYNSVPNRLDFGDKNNPNAAKAATGFLGFYDKECAFECTASPVEADGASKRNGAMTNIGNGGMFVEDGRYGVLAADGTNNNKFQFFRDNARNNLTMDVWYPVTNGVVSYDGHPAVSTTVTRDADGTPSVTGDRGGKFTVRSGNTVLFDGKRPTAEQKNWALGEFSNSTGTLLRGLHRTFSVAGSWASDEGLPNILNAKWEYRPQVSTRIYSHNIGFGAGGERVLGSVRTVSTAVDGKCYANFGTNKSISTVDEFVANTGTGTINNLDTGLLQDSNRVSPEDFQTNLVIEFVRATTE